MPATRARVASIRTAARAGDGEPGEDRIFMALRAVIVLDGASQPLAPDRNGGWLAEQLGECVRLDLEARPDAELSDVVAAAIRTVADRYSLVPGESPSATLAIVRWSETTMDAYVLGDTPVIARTASGEMSELRDDRLSSVGREFKHRRPGQDFRFDDESQWRALVDAQRHRRNRDGGYWIAEADPEAAHHAIQTSWPLDGLQAVLVVTDGVSRGVDQYQHPPDWPSAFRLAGDAGPEALIDAVTEAENSDPHGQRWHRSKRHDDKAAVLIDIEQN
jgi:Protein phosphatase 2C